MRAMLKRQQSTIQARRGIVATKLEAKESTPAREYKTMKMHDFNALLEKDLCSLHRFSGIVVRLNLYCLYTSASYA